MAKDVRYEGDWFDNRFYGKGTLTSPNGYEQEDPRKNKGPSYAEDRSSPFLHAPLASVPWPVEGLTENDRRSIISKRKKEVHFMSPMRTRSFCIIAILIAIPMVFFVAGSASACSWDSVVNKCHPIVGEVVVYKHNSCNGSQYYAFNGNNQLEWPNLTQLKWPDGSSLNDSISCIVVGPKTTSRYYQHINYGGKSAMIKNKNNDSFIQKKVGGTWWNDTISSVKVSRD